MLCMTDLCIKLLRRLWLLKFVHDNPCGTVAGIGVSGMTAAEFPESTDGACFLLRPVTNLSTSTSSGIFLV